VLVLRDIQGLSGGATAEALGLSRAAMKSRLHRGREALRLRLSTREKQTVEDAPANRADTVEEGAGDGKSKRP